MSSLRTSLQNWSWQLLRQVFRQFFRLLLQLSRPVLRRLSPPLDWRLLIWLVGVGLILISTRMPWLEALDRQLFRLGTALMPTQLAPTPIDVLRLSRSEMQQLLHDPIGSSQTTALLYALTASTRPVGIFLPELPRILPFSAERLLQDTPPSAPIHQAWQAREHQRTRLLTWLASPQVYLTTRAQAPYLSVDAHIVEAATSLASEDATLLQRLTTNSIPTHSTLAVALGAGTFRIWPTANGDDSHNSLDLNRNLNQDRNHDRNESALTEPLIWRHGDALYPGLVLGLLHAAENREADSKAAYRWQSPHTLTHQADQQTYLLNPDGSIYPAYQTATGLAPRLNQYNIKNFLQQSTGNTLLLIGVAGDATVDRMAGTLQSLQSGYAFHSPWWTVVLEKGLVALILVYALWVMPKFGNGVRVLISVLLLLVLATTQVGYQVTQLRWLPLGTVMQYLIFATAMVMLWRRQQKPVEQLQAQHHDIAVQWCRHLMEQSQLDQAMAVLQPCASTPDVLELLYEIGGQHERRRRPASAIAVYRVLQQRKRRYKDVAKRIKQLEQPQSVAHTMLAPSLSKTVVIGDAHSQPQFGRYQVESELGRGAMGVVYLGFDPKISRRVAIKTLDYSRYEGDELAAVKSRFFREAEAAGRLRHPNIVSVYDVGEDHDLAYIAMDYVEGQPLSDFTKEKTQLPASEVYAIIADVADALHYAHGESIVHRDIKPSNILYHRESRKVTVTDFGIARIVNDQNTQTGEILGSPLYMSPEQILGKKVDKASDIFSLGVTLFQLLTGELPFKGSNIPELSRQITQGKPANIRDLRPSLPPSARRIINKALQKEPRDRYRDAADMASALRNAD